MKKTTIILLLLFCSIQSHGQNDCKKLEEQLFVSFIKDSIVPNEGDLNEFKSCSENNLAFSIKKLQLNFSLSNYEGVITQSEEVLFNSNLPDSIYYFTHFYIGRAQIALGNYQKALQNLLKASSVDYLGDNTSFYLGFTYSKIGDTENSIKHYQNAVIKNPRDHSSINNLGVIYEENTLMKRALNSFIEADSISKGEIPLYKRNIINNLIYQDKWDTAYYLSKQFYRKFPFHPGIVDRHAHCLNHFGKHKEAIRISLDIVKRKVGLSDAFFRIAYSYDQLGILDSAIFYYEMNIKLHEDQCGYANFRNLGLLYSKMGYFDKANIYFEKSLELNPTYRSTYLDVHNNYRYQGKFKESIVYLDKAYELDSNYYRMDSYYGYIYLLMGEYEKSKHHLLKYINENKAEGKHYNNLGRVYAKTGEYEKAINSFEQALKLDPNNSYVYHNMASMYSELNKHDLACSNLEKALELEYNWIIDSSLILTQKKYCPEISIEREIILYSYKGNNPELSEHSFINRISDKVTNDTIYKVQSESSEMKFYEKSNKHSQNELLIYPNPSSSGVFNIVGVSTKTDYKIYDSGFSKIEEGLLNPDNTLHLENFRNGLYHLMTRDNNGIIHHSILILE